MSKQAHLADGTVLDFPDDTPDDVMDSAVRQHITGGVATKEELFKSYSDAQALAHPIDTDPEHGIGPGIVRGVKGIITAGPQFIKDLATPEGMQGVARKYVIDPAIEQGKKAYSDYQAGHTSEAIGHGLAAALPIVGPMAADIGERLPQDPYGVTAEVGTGLLLGKGVSKLGEVADLAANRVNERPSNNSIMRREYPELYTKHIENMADAYGVKSGESRFKDFAETANVAMDEIKKSAKDVLNGPIASNREQIFAGKAAMDRIYNTEIGPKVGLVGSTDLRPLAERLKSQIPAEFNPTERQAIERNIDRELSGTMTGPEMEKLRQKFSAADRVNQAVNNYVGKALEKKPQGWAFKNMDMGLRDFLADEVSKVQPGVDIRPALNRYGKVTDLVQQSGGIPVDKSTMELLTGKAYITGTAPNITGRVVEAAVKKWFANDNLIRRSYAEYEGPVNKVEAPKTGVATTAGTQQDLISYPDNTDQHAIPPSDSNQGNLFGPQSPLQGQNLSQQLPMGRRMQESMQSSNNAPVNAMESLIPHKTPDMSLSGPVHYTSVDGQLLTPEEYQAHVASRAMGPSTHQAPSETMSTRINKQALYGPANQKAITAGPFKFTISGNSPLEIKVGAAGEKPRVLQSTTDTSGSMANQFPPNHQLDSTTHDLGLRDGTKQTVNSGGPGDLITSDPKVIENAVAQYDRLIKSTRVKTKLAELQSQRDALVKQLIEYNKQRGQR